MLAGTGRLARLHHLSESLHVVAPGPHDIGCTRILLVDLPLAPIVPVSALLGSDTQLRGETVGDSERMAHG